MKSIMRNLKLNSDKKARLIYMLLFMSACCCMLLLWRAAICERMGYLFLVWNLFLALIPLGFSYKLYRVYESQRGRYFLIPALGILWLLFFPNAPYIITDFIHLEPKDNIPMWFDAGILFSFALTALLSGLISLYFIHELLSKLLKAFSWPVIIFLLFLSGYGVFLGRIRRWNSWDIVVNTKPLLVDSIQNLSNETAITITCMFGFLLLISYGIVRTLINEE
ncbi:MAG: DUF1361 domain-containing protein [Cytophagaceae bacterium]